MMTVGLVVPCYNNFPITPECIESVRDQFRAIDQIVWEGQGNSVSEALNIGIGKLETDLVLVLGADDFMIPGSITELRNALAASGGDLAYGNYIERFTDAAGCIRSELVITPAWLRQNMRETNFPSYHILYKRSLWQEVGGYDESMPSWEDWEFAARLMRRGVTATKVNTATFVHVQRPGGKQLASLTKHTRSTMLGWMLKRVPEVFG